MGSERPNLWAAATNFWVTKANLPASIANFFGTKVWATMANFEPERQTINQLRLIIGPLKPAYWLPKITLEH